MHRGCRACYGVPLVPTVSALVVDVDVVVDVVFESRHGAPLWPTVSPHSVVDVVVLDVVVVSLPDDLPQPHPATVSTSIALIVKRTRTSSTVE